MKDSGVEWIGEIPDEWSIKRVKQLFTEVNERCENGNEHTLLSVSEYYGIAPKADKISENEFLTHADSLDGYKICRCGDIIMNIMLAWKRALGCSKYDGIVSPAYCVFRPITEIDAWYFHYLFRTDTYADLFKQHSTGIIDSRLRLYPDIFGALYCHFPPLAEQRKISSFLDKKCAEIDDLVEKTRNSIEEYKKLKQAVITEAVTKGVRGKREMKDSGVEWIGEIPKEWDILKLRYLGTCQNGISKNAEAFGSGYPFVSYGDVYNNYALPKTVSGLVESTDAERSSYSVRYGDVFFTRTSETIEEVAFTSVCLNTIDNAVFAGFVIRFRPNNEQTLCPRYSKYYFRCEVHRKFFVKEMNIVTRASLSQELLKKLPVLLPSTEEQQEIADYLDKKTAEIDTLIAKKEALLEELDAYKKSLIYEYVTGKKQVVEA